MKNKIVIVVILFLSLSQCKPDGPHYTLNDEIKEWVDFKEDTWWLYEDEITGKQDCLWITKNEAATWYDEIDKRIKESGDYIWLYIENTDTTRETFMSVTAGNYNEYFSIYDKENNVDTVVEFNVTILSFNPQLSDSTYNGKSKIIERFSNYPVNNIEYSDVVHICCEVSNEITVSNVSEWYYSINEYWIAKHEGVIKKILRNPYDTSIWVLQDYEIIKD